MKDWNPLRPGRSHLSGFIVRRFGLVKVCLEVHSVESIEARAQPPLWAH